MIRQPRAGRCFNCKRKVGGDCYGCKKRVCNDCDDGLAGPNHEPKHHLGPQYRWALRIAAGIALSHAHDMARMARAERKAADGMRQSREVVASIEGMAHEALCIYSEIKARAKE